jgi:hypothetical protein
MVAWNGNSGYLAIDGVDYSGKVTEMTGVEAEVGDEEVTAGFGATDVERAAKLKDRSGKITIAYEEGRVPTYIGGLQAGKIVNVVYGPEGAVSGKPKHQQSVLITKLGGLKQTVDKTMIVFECDWKQAAKPTADLHAGAVFA